MSFGQPTPPSSPNTTSSIGPTITTRRHRPSLTHRQSISRPLKASVDDRRAHSAQHDIALHSLHHHINHRQLLLLKTIITTQSKIRHVKIVVYSSYQLQFSLFTLSSRPQSATTSKFTLHSTQLPRPQYPVPVRVSAVACPPPYRRSTTFTAFSASPNRSALVWTHQNQVQASTVRLMDTKGAKHAANVSTKRAGVGMNGR